MNFNTFLEQHQQLVRELDGNRDLKMVCIMMNPRTLREIRLDPYCSDSLFSTNENGMYFCGSRILPLSSLPENRIWFSIEYPPEEASDTIAPVNGDIEIHTMTAIDIRLPNGLTRRVYTTRGNEYTQYTVEDRPETGCYLVKVFFRDGTIERHNISY